MSSTNIPSGKELEQMEPSRNKTVEREDDEGYILTIHIVSGNAIQKTNARTYTREYGHYFISPQSKPSESLDEFISTYVEQERVLTNFHRERFEGYEVMIEVNDVRATSIDFQSTKKVEVKIPSHSNYISNIDEIVENIDSELPK